MSLSPLERAFLEKLAGMKQGRIGMTEVGHTVVQLDCRELLDRGFIVSRRLDRSPGYQITDAGKAYLGGLQS